VSDEEASVALDILEEALAQVELEYAQTREMALAEA